MPGVVVGVGSRFRRDVEPTRARQKFGLANPFVVYVGRIDANKGCAELFDFFTRVRRRSRDAPLDLVLIGTPVLPIPAHPRIRHLGFVTDQDKFDAIAAAEALVMPSYYESLSMVALEAWALGTPVSPTRAATCCSASASAATPACTTRTRASSPARSTRCSTTAALAAALGRNGREYFERHYSWPVIERKYLDMFERLASEPPAHAHGAAAGLVGPAAARRCRRRPTSWTRCRPARSSTTASAERIA